MSNYLTHKTRYSDSSIYDEVCIWCGATDAWGDERLEKPCPNVPKDDFPEDLFEI